ncbi:MAG: SixA phosphatase family protein [Pirellula sp.]|jgi:phosphohistidine phosphatase|nr:histidine phosphatase family protein [Pirellula sp.]
MNRTLILMRHAKSDWNQSGLSDKDRPLNARGNDAAPRMARWLLEQGILPDRVCCSSAVRTRETLDWILRVFGEAEQAKRTEIAYFDELYLAPSERILRVANDVWRQFPDEPVLLMLGHNPGMEDLVSELSGQPTSMPTAAIAIFCCEEAVADGISEHGVSFSKFRLTHFQAPKKLAT